MNYVFVVSCIIMIARVARRRIDFLSIGAICHIIYNYHCAFGSIYIASHEVRNSYYYIASIDYRVYIIVLVQMLILYVSIIIYDRNNLKLKEPKEPFLVDTLSESSKNQIFIICCIISWIIMIYNVMRVGISNFGADKAFIWSQISGLYVTGNWIGMAVFAYAIKNKNYILAIIGSAPVLLHFFFGSRAYFAAVGIVFIIYYGDKIHISKNILKKIWIFVLGIVGAAFVLAYKRIYMLVRSGNISEAINVLFDAKTYSFVTSLGEPRIVLANLNYIIENNIKLGIGDLIDRLISIVPYLNNFVRPDKYQAVSTILREGMSSSYGLASNIWGEFYALGSFFLVFVMFFLWIRMLKWGNDLIRRDDWSAYFWVPLVAYLSFYIHRLDFVKAIGNIKMVLMGIVIFYIVQILVTRKTVIALKSHERNRF